MAKDTCKITVGYKWRGRGEDITEQINGETIQLELSTGQRIQIEPFERHPGRIVIRSIEDSLTVSPQAANAIAVG